MAKIDRQCHRRDGKPKARLTRSEAERRAQAAPPQTPTDAYRCATCGAWHVGTPSR